VAAKELRVYLAYHENPVQKNVVTPSNWEMSMVFHIIFQINFHYLMLPFLTSDCLKLIYFNFLSSAA
jgi:hypothetical protein